MTISSLTIGLSTHAPRSLVSPIRNMVRKPTSLRVTYVLLLICFLLLRCKAVSSQDFSDGGRQVLEWTASGTVRNDAERLLSTMSSVCRIIHQEGERKYCFGALVSSRWLATAVSCAPHDRSSSNHHVRVICGRESRSPASSQNEFGVVEIKTLRSATTGQKQKHDITLLKLDADVPGPCIVFEESDGPGFYILEQKEVMDILLRSSGLGEGQTEDAWQNANIDLIGLPLLKKPSSMRNRDSSENSLHQITTCCLATACQLFSDGVKRCVFSRITPLERKSLCLATGTCNELPSASRMTPSFRRSLSAFNKEDACLDSSRPIPLAERGLIPLFERPPFCAIENMTELQSMSREQIMHKLKHLVNIDDATGVSETLTCSEFNVSTLDNHHETFLHDAAWHNSSRSAKVLCELGINTEMKNKQGKTALLVAANRTSLETLKVILNFSVNVNAVDKRGRTALYYAVNNCDANMTKFLLQNEANPLIKDDKGKKPRDLISELSETCDNSTVQDIDSMLEKAETKQK